MSLPSTRTLSAGGILAYSPDVFPELPFVDWADSRAVAAYCGKLPVVKLLGGRLRSRYESGSIFGNDYSWLVSQVYSEWFGLFGFSGGQICPGMRVPFPKAVTEKAYLDSEFFHSLSAGYFHAFGSIFFGGASPFDPVAPWVPEGVLRPAFWFFKNATFTEFKRGSDLYLRAVLNINTRYYLFDASRRVWNIVKEPTNARWSGVKNSNFWFFFFPYEGRLLWGPAAEAFFKRFSFPIITKGEFQL